MDSALAGLLHGCAGEPDDPAPRLILADWLEDHGQPERAAFIRLQCRLAAWVPTVKERQALLSEQDEQLARHRAAWLGPLDDLCDHVEFVGGLCRVWVRGKTLSGKAFRAALDAHAGTALIESLRPTRVTRLKRLAAFDLYRHLPGLSLTKLYLDDATLADFLASPHLETLAALDLSNNELTPASVPRLRDSVLPRLSRLEIRNNLLDGQALRQLLDRRHSPRLRDLDPMGNVLDAADLAFLARWRAEHGGPTRRVMNSVGMEFVPIPAGEFLMGSTDEEMQVPGVDRDNEGPQRLIRLTRPFWLGRFAVTQAAFLAVMGTNPARFSDNLARPVEMVSFETAQEFCAKLSALPAERKAGRSYRLPTEAEWEHACRAGTFTPFHYGPPPSADFVNYDGRHHYGGAPEGAYVRRPQPVGTYPPNDFGLYEMHGNVWEWTTDVYRDDYDPDDLVDPTGPGPDEDEGKRPIRGGCWEAVGAYCRSAHRYGEETETEDIYTGFRVVLVLA